MFAKVIVDVPTYHVDRAFDYVVPAHLQTLIEVGSRVKVPFGRRPVLGFVIALTTDSDVPANKLKSIATLMDLEPVLTPELLALAQWLKQQTICFQIDALQAMLPSALRAKYEKAVDVLVAPASLPSDLQPFVRNNDKMHYQELEKANMLPLVKKEVQRGHLRITTKVKQRGNVKRIRYVKIGTAAEIERALTKVSTRAKKQQALLAWCKAHSDELVLPRDIDASAAVLNQIIAHGAATYVEKEVYRDPFTQPIKKTAPLTLTTAQQRAKDALQLDEAGTYLLHGVTGSGKTEVYLQAIQQVIDAGKQAIMLVPEIALTPQMTERFRGRFGERVAVMHSGLSSGEKFDEWRKITQQEVQVVVGARSAIFAPFTNVGIIILDEEHEATYKQEDAPRYHARDVAIWRSEFHQCPVILGSATPSLESYARAKKGVYTLLTLEERAMNQPLPSVEVVDMRDELRSGNRSMFSVSLLEEMQAALARQEQIVLFLNRRGYSSFVMCRDCGTVVQCQNCDISLTYHRNQEKLRCHYCGYEASVPKTCSTCASDRIRYFGTGTQKVEEAIYQHFPSARVLRMDVDTTRKKGAHEQILGAFGRKEADILLGTQMIAKGLDFPNITVVGVLSADTSLHLPDFRASEKTFQLLTQVSGRAGRHEKLGRVVVQTYTPTHYAITLAQQQAYVPFYEQEMRYRQRAGYPPYFFIALIQVTHTDVLQAGHYAQLAASWLRQQLPSVHIIGPTASAISRLQNRYRYQCLIKYKIEPNLIPTLHRLLAMYRADWQKQGVQLTVDLDPSMI
ncbi:primosomal protein N' [Metalysinibacillus jejuensis]|uniref:primosomal protein N' n=1 Tax=Metalysinibacillus jejuensis TaxID=914327 RepID=UPI000D373E28|nr:primosomal protein N' [Metalysinibacillus jejuensis]